MFFAIMFPRIIDELTCHIVGIPLIIYFDDFGDLPPAPLEARVLAVFTSFCEHLGITMCGRKSEVGAKLAYLGLLGEFHSSTNGAYLSATFAPDMDIRLSDTARRLLRGNMISPHAMGKLVGELFAPIPVFSLSSPAQSFDAYTESFAPEDTSRISRRPQS